ncbi:hypothetical protein [Cupriavidus neocaledonicus]|uniref:Morphogenetic protein n=1 Tax=Cupriavidus neocaledonicus TaxID=1040979 RepID=A0A375H9E0_9BURK|nr:hypothetical protein [Cupriavidus neocaledonicus]SPD47506.1 conserved protein of unknown function [Cupriavidus neocaledonicus]
MIKERPILFSGAMVRAILDGKKTQTRRVLNQATGPSLSVDCNDGGLAELSWLHGPGPGYDVEEAIKHVACPYGKPGDRLWVRETHYAFGRWETRFSPKKGRDEWHFVDLTLDSGREYQFPDTFKPVAMLPRGEITPSWWKRPAIFMPRVAARIVPEVVATSVERLNDCSEADAEAEGIAFLREVPDVDETLTARQLYECLWDSINGAGAWDTNPWVWVIEFTKLET